MAPIGMWPGRGLCESWEGCPLYLSVPVCTCLYLYLYGCSHWDNVFNALSVIRLSVIRPSVILLSVTGGMGPLWPPQDVLAKCCSSHHLVEAASGRPRPRAGVGPQYRDKHRQDNDGLRSLRSPTVGSVTTEDGTLKVPGPWDPDYGLRQ